MGWGERFNSVYNEYYSEVWPWFNPGSRLYILNVISAILISLAFIYILQKRKHTKIRFSLRDEAGRFQWSSFFNISYWFHPSAQVDYKIYFINGFIKVLFFAPVLGLSLYFSMYTIKALYFVFPDFNSAEGNGLLFLLATIFAFVWDDFLRFFHHMMMHKIPSLWTLHKTHHSAEVLTPITLYRIHPLESLLASFRNALSLGVSAGIFMFLFSGSVNFVTLLGVNVFGFVFNLTAGNLRHSQIPIAFGIFEYVFISPKQHQIHHSNKSEHFDKNYGVALSVWDQIFGSFLRSKDEEILGYGVEGMDAANLSQQFWPWESITTDKIISFKDEALKKNPLKHLSFKLFTLMVLFFNPIESKADNSCAISLSDQAYFIENRFVSVTAMNVILNTRSDIPGRFRASLIQPRRQKGKVIPAYFAKYSLEKKYIELRHPAGPEVHWLWVSGHLEWMEDEAGKSEMVLMITNLWRKDPRIQFDPESDNILSFNQP